jgi:PAS domain S-box-containing protein
MPFTHLLAGLRARLIILVLAAILPASILLLVSSLEQRQSAVDKQRDGALAQARLLAGNQASLIEATRQNLEWIAQFPEVQSDNPEACSRRLEQLLANSSGIRGFAVADMAGNVFCVAPRDPTRLTFNIAGRSAFTRAVQARAFVMGDVITGSLSGRPNLTFGYPVIDATGRLEKVITVGIDVENIQATLRQALLPSMGLVAVLDPGGQLIGYAGPTDAAGNPAIDQAFARTLLASEDGYLEATGSDGVQRVYAFAPHLLNGAPVLFAGIGYPTSTLYATADMQLRRNLVVLALFAGLTMLAAWLAGDVMIVRRARSVIQAASRLRHGDLSARAGGPYGSGELSTLAHDFDAMASQLEQRHKERDQAMRDLATSKARHERLVSAVSSIVWTSDREGRCNAPMPAWEAFTGQHWPAYANDGGFSVVHPEDRARLTQVWQESIHSRTPVEAEYRLWHAPSGGFRHVYLRGVPLLDESARVVDWIGIITDIHQRKQAEQDRQLLLDASDAMRRAEDEAAVLGRLAELLAPSRADWCSAAVVDAAGQLVRLKAGAQAQLDDAAAEVCSVPLAQAAEAMPCLRSGEMTWIEQVTPAVLAKLHGGPQHARQLQALHQHGLRELMFVPVMVQGAPAGLLTLGLTQPNRRFDAATLSLMAEIARRAALTIENQRLYREERESRLRAERNADYLSRLQSVSSSLSMLSTPSITQASEAILDVLMRSFGASTGAISTVSPDGKWLDLVCWRGYAEEVAQTFMRVEVSSTETAATEVIRTGEPVLLHDQASYLARYPRVVREFVRFNDHACAVAPIKIDNRVAGVIALNFDRPRDFSSEDKNLLMTLSTQGAQVMARAHLFDEEQQSRLRAERNAHYLSRLQRVSSAISSLAEPSVRQLIDTTLDALMQSFGATTGAISMVSPDGQMLEVTSARGYSDEELAGFKRVVIAEGLTAAAQVAATGEPVWARDNAAYLQGFPRSSAVYQRGRDNACAVVPVKVKQRVVGVIALNFEHERDFNPEDRDLLMTLSTQCGQAMERMQLYEEMRRLNLQLEARVQDRTRQLETTIVQLRKSREQLRELSGQLLAAVEEERKRISQEVHDELGQALTVIKMDLGFARRKLNGDSSDVAQRLDETMGHIDETIRIMRRIATDLRPGILDSLGLEAAIESLVQDFDSRTGIRCNLLKSSSDRPIFDKDISIAAYRIVQEALTNIARHSRATEVDITYAADDERLYIEIHDNGVGISDAPESGAKSLGLRGMHERARHVHGTVMVQGGPGKGTTVMLDVGLKPDASAHPSAA